MRRRHAADRTADPVTVDPPPAREPGRDVQAVVKTMKSSGDPDALRCPLACATWPVGVLPVGKTRRARIDRRATAGRVPRRSHVARPRLPETEVCIQVVRVQGVCTIHRESATRPKSIISSTVVAQAPAHDAQGRRRHRPDSPTRRLRRVSGESSYRAGFDQQTQTTPRSSHLLLDVIACTPSMPIRLLGKNR